MQSSMSRQIFGNYLHVHRGWGHSGIERLPCIVQLDGESGPEQGVSTLPYRLGTIGFTMEKYKDSSKTYNRITQLVFVAKFKAGEMGTETKMSHQGRKYETSAKKNNLHTHSQNRQIMVL